MSSTFGHRPNTAIDDDAKQTYIGLWLLKKIDLGTSQEGGMQFPVALPAELSPLDEPLQHLDLRHQRDVLVRLRRWAGEGDRAVVMSLHDPVAARRFCDHALLLYDDGSWRAGRADALLDDAMLEGLYGCALGGEDAASQGRSGRHV